MVLFMKTFVDIHFEANVTIFRANLNLRENIVLFCKRKFIYLTFRSSSFVQNTSNDVAFIVLSFLPTCLTGMQTLNISAN